MAHPPARDGVEIVGRYALHGQIASGGMAVVYYGRLLGPVGFSRPVAIKRLHPRLAREEDVRRMFIDEARLASRIAHPNVVPTLDVVEDGDELLLVLEYVHGLSLQQLLRAARENGELVPLRVALGVATAVLHGLQAAHEATGEDGLPLHIVHRDVSPQNVLVGADGVARVLDFGIARATDRLGTTREGVVKGKLAYMAPEQLGGATVDARADVYAAAVMLWEMLSGRRLFVREDGGAVQMEKLLRGTIEPPSHHRPGIPRLLDAITLHGLARNPEQRFASAREMALALEKLGEIARPSEIGEWVEMEAGEVLAERRLRVQQLEATSSTFRASGTGGTGGTDDVVIDLVGPAGRERTPPRALLAPAKLPSPVPPSYAPRGLAISVSARPAPRAWVGPASYALLGASIVFGAMMVLVARVDPRPARSASPAPTAAPRAAAAIAAPPGPALLDAGRD